MRIEFTARASREARSHGQWWREYRTAAPDLFERELVKALDQIRTAPRSGTMFLARSGREYRRLLLPSTQYYVYFQVLAPELVRVHAIWSALRGRGPSL